MKSQSSFTFNSIVFLWAYLLKENINVFSVFENSINVKENRDSFSHACFYCDKILIGPDLKLADKDNIQLRDTSVVQYTPESRSHTILQYSGRVTGDYYWSLPKQFLGNQVCDVMKETCFFLSL